MKSFFMYDHTMISTMYSEVDKTFLSVSQPSAGLQACYTGIMQTLHYPLEFVFSFMNPVLLIL